MGTKKYKLTEETIKANCRTLYRIEALKDFGNVKKVDKGGFVENEDNLSQYDDCWIYGNAQVYDNAKVCGKAEVCANAKICSHSLVTDNGEVFGNAKVYHYGDVCGKARICGDAKIRGINDYIAFQNWWGSGRCCTLTKSNLRVVSMERESN